MPRVSLLCLLLLLLAVPCVPAAEDAPPFKIILPSGEAHELLPKTCSVCHKGETLRFFIVSAPGQEGLEKALAALKSPGSSLSVPSSTEKPKNVHASTACAFCHVEPPKPDDNPASLPFRTLDGTSVKLGDVQRLCEMCHPGAEKNHARVLGSADAAEDLAAAGLPVRDGKVNCTTCHDMHSQDVGPAAVRKEYASFAATSMRIHPHGVRSGCRACHLTAEPTGPTFVDDDPSKRCARCHVESHAKIHAVNGIPSDKTFPMTFLSYPLDAQGRLSCSTCHDHVCQGKPDSNNRSFLRGGPYAAVSDFCYKCHPKAGVGGLNPHNQVDSKGNVIGSVCTFCHKKQPLGDAFDPTELLYVRSMVELCVRCHDQGPHPAVNHLVELSENMKAKLNDYEKRHKVTLPLDPQGKIVCTTCHNPHDKGVLRNEAALGAGERRKLRIPSFAELCTPCHARYD